MAKIVYKTKDYLFINKSPGVPSQPDKSGDEDAMTITARQLKADGETDALFLIHRLDRGVGGLMVFARNKRYAALLSSLVAEHNFVKEYYAVVDGIPEGESFVDYIYKDSTLNKAFVTDRKRGGVKEAILDFSLIDSVTLDSGRVLSLVRVKPRTGRFHQIRVQFASRKMPLVGDKKYGSKDALSRTPALFAYRLAFNSKGIKADVSCLPNLDAYPWSLFEKQKYEDG